MLFSVIISIFVVVFCFMIDNSISMISQDMVTQFGAVFIQSKYIFINAEQATLESACPLIKDQLISVASTLEYFILLVIISGVGYFTAVV